MQAEVSQSDVDAKRLSCRLLVEAEQLHRATDPYDVVVQTQRTLEQQVQAHAREHGLELLTVRTTWECRVEAVAE